MIQKTFGGSRGLGGLGERPWGAAGTKRPAAQRQRWLANSLSLRSWTLSTAASDTERERVFHPNRPSPGNLTT